LTCEDAIPPSGRERPSPGSIQLGPVEFLGLGRLGGAQVARRGGVKVPLLVEPGEPATIRIERVGDALAFVELEQPAGVFPPGRPC
jgi:hypothetical protein